MGCQDLDPGRLLVAVLVLIPPPFPQVSNRCMCKTCNYLHPPSRSEDGTTAGTGATAGIQLSRRRSAIND